MYKNKNGGFSLLELIVVIAIMAVLGGIVIGNSNYSKSAQVKKYTELTDGFMRKARTEIMSKNTVSGVCLYEKEGCYYIESYKEKEKGNHSNTDNSQFFFYIPFRLPIAPPPD